MKVINFHEISNQRWFDDVICLLKSKFRLIDADTLFQFKNGSRLPGNICHITVDDGDNSFYKVIFPILKKHRVPVSLFVSPKICKEQTNYWFQEIKGYDLPCLQKVISDVLNIKVNQIDRYSLHSVLLSLKIKQIEDIILRYRKETNTPSKEAQNLSVKQLLEIDNSGLVTIGAHTLNHPVLANEDDDTSAFEIARSIVELADILGHNILYFAYPNGIPELDFTDRENKYLASNGIKLSFSTEPRDLRLSDDPQNIPRYGLSYGSMNFVRIKLLMGSYWGKIKLISSGNQVNERKRFKQVLS